MTKNNRPAIFRCLSCTGAARAALALAALSALFSLGRPVLAERLDEMPLERWKELREVERYQLNIAERYFKEKNWKVALDEYNKFLTLYERSIGASYAQLKWSLCQVNLRKPNTAIKEGFQSVIDYWPDSPDAIASSFYIGQAYEHQGEVKKAKKAYQVVLQKHPDHLVAVYAMTHLIDLAGLENDNKTRVALWNRLTFDTKRTPGDAVNLCQTASQQLAVYQFYSGAFDEAVKALATTYAEKDLPYQVLNFGRAPLSNMTGDDKSKAKGEKVTEQAIAYVRRAMPGDLTKDDQKAVARQYWFYIADLHSAARQYEKVPEVYNQMIKLFGADDEILGRLAQWYKGQNQYDRARETYARYKDQIEGKNQIAYSYREQKKIPLAVEAYRRLAAEDSEHEVRWVSEIAGTYWGVQMYKEYIATNEELLQLDPDNAQQYRWNIAYGYHSMGSYKEAIGHYRQCDKFPDTYIQMASCHRALSEFNEALLLYNQVIGSSPDRAPWAWLQIGYTQEQAGKKEAAIKAFQHVCKLFPKDGHASQAHAHLQNKYNITITLGGAKSE